MTLGVADEDITPGAKSLKITFIHANTKTPREERSHVSTSSKETGQANDHALHLETRNVESTSREN